MKNRQSLTLCILLTLGLSYGIQASPTLTEKQPNKIDNINAITHPQEGREYVTLANPLASQPSVVEFFSFYCGPCYQFIEQYPVAAAINRSLPDGNVIKYHVNAMGSLGNELTEAWAIAIVMGKTDQVEKPLFEAIRNKKLNSIADIQSIFSQVGVDATTYEQSRQSLLVKGTVARQNTAIEAFAVTSTPSFYVNGKYQINNSGVAATSPQEYVDNFASVVHALLQK
ncbi:Thiol:disulfide interchange protein DsbA precursor [Serratia proteamaculans]|uniref:DsbA family protein n=1 Tax=Serratia proteamaculans TaxID=28151 RepID=UPI002179B028|nr:DsbA family protein [Serratia proteamaculans]CAI2021434.1 Thiol:disulfide interchange protein DsbA precursor [Serratia proteamaculans]